MKNLLSCILCFVSFSCIGQDKTTKNYLAIRIEKETDFRSDREVFYINAEQGCRAAKTIYDLKKYNFKKSAENSNASFFYYQEDTEKEFYNYFLSHTEILNFMAQNGWILIIINNEIISNAIIERNISGLETPVAKISSIPIYYFEK